MRDASVESKTPGFSLTCYKTLLVVVAGLVSAGLLYFGTGLHPTWWLLWLAPVPVLAIAPRLRASAAFLLGSIAWFLGEMNQWNYLRHVIALPLRITILFFVIAAVIFGLSVLFTRSFLRRGSLFLAAFAFPVYWVIWNISVRSHRLTAHGAISLTHKWISCR
jgi:apolipoprotein N-acyltransferase